MWARIDGTRCLTTKVNPVWYSSETETDCLESGRAVPVATTHEDVSIVSSVAAVLVGFGAGKL